MFRTDGGGVGRLARPPVRGAVAVARQMQSTGGRFAALARPAIVNGAVGAVVRAPGGPPVVIEFTVARGRIAAIDIIGDPAKLSGLDVS